MFLGGVKLKHNFSEEFVVIRHKCTSGFNHTQTRAKEEEAVCLHDDG